MQRDPRIPINTGYGQISNRDKEFYMKVTYPKGICNNCGNLITYTGSKNQARCWRCKSTVRKLFYIPHMNKEEISNFYLHYQKKTGLCHKCGHIWSISHHLMEKRVRCPNCRASHPKGKKYVYRFRHEWSRDTQDKLHKRMIKLFPKRKIQNYKERKEAQMANPAYPKRNVTHK